MPALAANGVRLSRWDDLDEDDEKFLVETFEQRIFPVLTPLAVDPGHPFPYISNLSLNLAVLLRDPVTAERRFARVKVPDLLPRFVVMPDGERFVPLEQVIAAHLGQLFPGMEVESTATFRVSRNADLTLEEEEAEDLLAAVEIELRRRQFGRAVRLEISARHHRRGAGAAPAASSTSARTTPTARTGPSTSAASGRCTPSTARSSRTRCSSGCRPARLDNGEKERPDFFDVLRDGDVLVHHPYDSFRTTVEEFIRQASVDPHVLAIKMTLYRTSGDSPIVRSLIRAAERGKQVAVLVELKARFDEGANIEWAKALETAGVHVVYGLVGPEGPHQDGARRARRARRHPPLLPHRLRQLQLEDGPHLRGRRAPHLRPRHRRRPHAALQLPHRLRPRRPLPDPPRVAAHHAARASRRSSATRSTRPGPAAARRSP